jgi:hypothetical protein
MAELSKLEIKGNEELLNLIKNIEKLLPFMFGFKN